MKWRNRKTSLDMAKAAMAEKKKSGNLMAIAYVICISNKYYVCRLSKGNDNEIMK